MMNEELEQFEQRLKRQLLRKIPGGWRAEILANCRGSKVEGRGQEQFWRSTLVARLSTIFWPHPNAWAGLAAIWIFILALNFSMRDKTPVVAEKVLPPSPEVVAELRQEKLLYAELIGSRDVREAEPPKFFPRPRTERVEILAT
jgi:hypothetical protein